MKDYESFFSFYEELKRNLRTLWENKYKQNSFKNFNYDKFLHLEIIVLPDPSTKEYVEKVIQIKERINNSNSPNYLLKSLNDQINIPIEALGLYLQKILNNISNYGQKSGIFINLNEEKQLIINCYLENLKKEIYKNILINSIQPLKQSFISNENVNLIIKGPAILQQSKIEFEKMTENFVKNNDYYLKEENLIEMVKQDLFTIFKKQINFLVKLTKKRVEEEISIEKLNGF